MVGRSVRSVRGVPVVVTAGVAAAVLLGGCGSSSSSSTPTTPPATAPTTNATGTAPSGYLRVTIKDSAFDPSTLQAKVGQTVVVTNEDSVVHNWVDKGGAFKSPDLDQGQSYSYTFQKAGTYNVYCNIHPDMLQTVVVT